MLEVRLVPMKDNYMFIDPDTGLHLTLIHNKGEVEKTSPFIAKGVLSGVITVKDLNPPVVEEIKTEENIEDVTEATVPESITEENIIEEVKEEATVKKTKTRTSKKTK